MSLFQNSVEVKYLNQIDSKLLDTKFNEFKAYFGNPAIQENIRNSKEEQFQEGFLRELFVKILGYTLNPNANFNLTTEYKNSKDSKKADGAIIINEIVKAVIELKETDTIDLNKIETQAFGYKNNQPDCVYVITSNFEKLRFYIDNAIEHLEFNLFTLTKQEFQLLYLCLSFDSISKGIPKKIKDESVSKEDDITKKLYQDYSLFKRELHRNLVALNPQFDPLTLFKKSQKLLDRFLFLFFAEDRQLLPPNSVRLVLNDWKELQERDEMVPLYDRFKKYFGYLNTGFKGKRYDVFAYNGGLFLPDEVLDNVKIDDNILFKHTWKLSEYNFVSEVDVNILGHIFENSLNDLEEINAQLEGKEVDKSKTKRKKDGVFYTPKYITKYIVDNTVGRLCAEKKSELQINDEDYATDKKRQSKTKQALVDKLKEYRNWLLQITICDPACGSGAFLNQALDFLINEHRYIDELQAKLFGDSMVFSDIRKSILENNIFGVDINEESVEIAKLALWLRTAEPNRKLNELNNNIKCGNSLIDDPAVAGEKAFNWKKEFPKVFRTKNKEAWHITTVLHNSRYAATDGFTRQPEPGFISNNFTELTLQEEEILAEELGKAAKEYNLNILECNICADHVHAIIVCEEEELSAMVGKWKGRSAFTYNRRVNPSVSDEPANYADGTIEKFWAKSFHKKEIIGEQQLKNTIAYIRNNRKKHQLDPATDGNKTADFTKPSTYISTDVSIDGLTRLFDDHRLSDTRQQNDTPAPTDGVTQQDSSASTDGLTRRLHPADDLTSQSNPAVDLTHRLNPSDDLARRTEDTTAATDGLTRRLDSSDLLVHRLRSMCCTYEHAFRTEYTGGFDVIIGNPPYGASLNELDKKYIELNFKTFEYQVNSYVIFYEKGISILKENGMLGFITPATFTYQFYFKKIRSLFLQFKQVAISKYYFEVFDDADIGDSVSWILSKSKNDYSKILVQLCNNKEDSYLQPVLKEYNEIVSKDSTYNLSKSTIEFNKFSDNNFEYLESISNIIVGIKPYQTGKGIPKQTPADVTNKKFTSLSKIDDTFIECIVGKDFHRYKYLNQPETYLSYGKWLAEPRESAPFFDKKIIVRQTADSLICNYDDKKRVNLNNVYNIGTKNNNYSLKYLLSLLNSKLLNYIYQSISQEKGRVFAEVKKINLAKLPIKKISLAEQMIFINKTDSLLLFNIELYDLSQKFQRTIQRKFNVEDLSTKLQDWYLLSYSDFIKELAKKKIKLSLSDEAEWENYFLEEQKKAMEIKTKIETTDKEIDQMVYKLYELTPEEIEIVEKS
jgi:REP element-mobilizing transposase RayT